MIVTCQGCRNQIQIPEGMGSCQVFVFILTLSSILSSALSAELSCVMVWWVLPYRSSRCLCSCYTEFSCLYSLQSSRYWQIVCLDLLHTFSSPFCSCDSSVLFIVENWMWTNCRLLFRAVAYASPSLPWTSWWENTLLKHCMSKELPLSCSEIDFPGFEALLQEIWQWKVSLHLLVLIAL